MQRLPPPLGVSRLLGEQPFPVSHPAVERDVQIVRGSKQMQVIRHQQIVADQPRLCFPPNLQQKLMHVRLRNPGSPMLRVHSDEHNGWLPKVNMDAGGRLMTARFIARRIHTANLMGGRAYPRAQTSPGDELRAHRDARSPGQPFLARATRSALPTTRAVATRQQQKKGK